MDLRVSKDLMINKRYDLTSFPRGGVVIFETLFTVVFTIE